MIKQIDTNGLAQSDLLGRYFEASHDLSKLSSSNFIRRFMFSIYEKLFSENTIMFEIHTEERLVRDIDNLSKDTRKGIRYSKDSLYWIGYIYEYWSYTYSIPLWKVYKLIKPDELNDMYFIHHTFDPAKAISRMIEAKGIKINKSYEELYVVYDQIIKARLKREKERRLVR